MNRISDRHKTYAFFPNSFAIGANSRKKQINDENTIKDYAIHLFDFELFHYKSSHWAPFRCWVASAMHSISQFLLVILKTKKTSKWIVDLNVLVNILIWCFKFEPIEYRRSFNFRNWKIFKNSNVFYLISKYLPSIQS